VLYVNFSFYTLINIIYKLQCKHSSHQRCVAVLVLGSGNS
jgi:hypothetical protein